MRHSLIAVATLLLAAACQGPSKEDCERLCWRYNELQFWSAFETQAKDLSPADRVTLKAERRRLPNRRGSETFAVECAGAAYVATISRFQDGVIGEVFVSNHRVGSTAGTKASDCAIAASLVSGLSFHSTL